MNVQKNDFRELLNIVMTVADKNFSELQIISLVETMQSLGWSGSQRVAMAVTRTPNLPKNIYGYFLNLLEEEIERLQKSFMEKDSWKTTNEDCIRPEEFSLMMKCIALICRFRNSNDLCQKFGDYLIEAQKKGGLLDALRKAFDFYKKQLDQQSKVKSDSSENQAMV